MLVDHERAWFKLKKVISEKRSHGQKDLAVAMANLEVECMLDDDNPPPEATVTKATTGAADAGPGMPIPKDPLLAQEARNGSSITAGNSVR